MADLTQQTMEPDIIATIAAVRRMRAEVSDDTVSDRVRDFAHKTLAEIATKVTAERAFLQGLQPFTRVLSSEEQSHCAAQLHMLVMLEHELRGSDVTAN